MDDLISRAYVLAEYDRQHKGPPGGARKIMEEAPAVDAVPVRHGHWIYKRGCWAECSECHHDYKDAYDLENSDNYCRHCGALMDGDGEART